MKHLTREIGLAGAVMMGLGSIVGTGVFVSIGIGAGLIGPAIMLFYYAITNLAALRLPGERRLFPVWIAWAGLVACLFLAFWVEPPIWLAGLALIGVGLIVQQVMRRRYAGERG